MQNILLRNFRTAAKGQGEYCPTKNEVRVRKGRKIYRFTLTGAVIRFKAPACPEVMIPIACDATIRELRRAIPIIIEMHEANQGKFSEKS